MKGMLMGCVNPDNDIQIYMSIDMCYVVNVRKVRMPWLIRKLGLNSICEASLAKLAKDVSYGLMKDENDAYVMNEVQGKEVRHWSRDQLGWPFNRPASPPAVRLAGPAVFEILFSP
ncbi:hypothetical protein Tco_0532367 [Tanacetum coccineum]